jgi:hypothetical protein
MTMTRMNLTPSRWWVTRMTPGASPV